jgi:flagellar basal-body rod protein FlgF
MQDSMYSAMFGALSQEIRLNNIANNLANVNTTGYKKDELAFKDTFIYFAHDRIMEPILNIREKKLFPEPLLVTKPRLALAKTIYEQGSLKDTGNSLDLAIAGDGFFKIRTENGDFFSRNGHFNMTPEGVLVTAQGYPLLGEGGEIAVPPNTRVEINGQGQIYANGEVIDQIQLSTVDDLLQLEKLGSNLYRLREGSTAAEIPATEASVNQGYLEASNVNVVEEMVNMIETQRSFESYQKVIQTTQQADQQAINKVGTAR